MHFVRRSHLMVPSLVAVLTAACGQGSATLSPTGPTASPADSNLSADVVTGVDSVTTRFRGGKGKGGGDSDENPGNGKPDAGEKENGKPENVFHGELSGFVTAVSGTALTVRGTSVTPTPDAVIRHGHRILLFSSIAIGDHVQARGMMTEGVLVASEIKVEQTSREGGDAGEVHGVISGLSSTTGCPVLTFMVGTTTVQTSVATDFGNVTCSALANGAEVEAEGTRQPDGSILATTIELDDDEDDEDVVKVEGQIAGLSSLGSCPAVSFTIGATHVATSASTKLEDVTCATLVNGMSVEVKGVVQADGSIAATKVELD